MGDAALEDFFAKKTKKKIKGSNLNVAAAAPKAEPKKKAKDAEEEGWEEEQVVTQTIKIEVAGKLTRDEDKKEEEDSAAPAWNVKKFDQQRDPRDEKKYPTLAKSVQSTNIQVDDGAGPKINISTNKNLFAALEGEDEDDDGGKRPKEIKPAMVQKKKGEREKVAIQREVDKWGGTKEKGDDKKERREAKDDDEEDEDDDESVPSPKEPTGSKKSKEEKAESKSATKAGEEEAEETPEDLLIKLDPELVVKKYASRRRLPVKDLPEEEMQEEKENRPARGPAGKKKKGFVEEEEDNKKILIAPDDF